MIVFTHGIVVEDLHTVQEGRVIPNFIINNVLFLAGCSGPMVDTQ